MEKINNAPKIQNNARKGSISDSSKDSSPAQKKEKNNTSFDNKKYSKDDIKEKFQKMSASKDDDHSFNLLPPPNISGRSAGVDNNSNQDRKNYTIQLLRAELLKQQTHSQTLSHKLNDAIKELDQTHLAKNNLEEEIIRLVKFEKNQQDNATRQSFVDDKNIKKNRVAGGFDAKAIKGKNTDKNQKKELKRTSAINTIVDTDDITEYLKSIENKKKAPEKVKNNDEYPIDESYKRAPIMKEEIENEKEKKDFDDITMFLQNRDKTFAQIKESGATKELKQYLRKMATQKKDFSKMNNEALNEFDEVFDSDSPELATEKIKNDNSTHKKNVGRKFNAKNSEKNKVIEVFSSVEKIRIDKGTMVYFFSIYITLI